jgi:hypothetical protein
MLGLTLTEVILAGETGAIIEARLAGEAGAF